MALAWQVALAVYMQLISWVPLGRWNFQPCCPTGLELLRRGRLSLIDAVELGAFVLPSALFWRAARSGWRWVMALALTPTAVWLGLQLWSWWPPYIFGASDRWSQVYARAFAQATPILPRWGNHLPPDAAHVVLQALLLGAVISGTMAVLRPPYRGLPTAVPVRPLGGSSTSPMVAQGSRSRNRDWWLLAAALVLFALWIASIGPVRTWAGRVGHRSDWIVGVAPSFLAACTFAAWSAFSRRRTPLASAMYAAAIVTAAEGAQLFMSGYTADIWDVAAGLVGAAVAIPVLRWRERRRRDAER